MYTKNCFQCRMEIPTDAKVCPFCKNDPRSDTEIELTNAAAQGLANVIATKKGNFVVASIFFGSFCAFMGWLFGDEFGALVGLVIGIYLAKLNNKMMFKDQ